LIDSKVIRNALEEVGTEVESLESEVYTLNNTIASLEGKLEDKDIEIDKLMGDIEELSNYVKDLETALAEAHLMSTDDGPGDPAESVI
jgi:peptidoglycan hydrolase CwlO-like protein